MNLDTVLIIAAFLKFAFVLGLMLNVAPLMVWAERRVCAWMQNRTGPNRVGPFGLFQALADTVKFIFKEDHIPGHVNKTFYMLAPAVVLIPAFLTFAVIPFGPVVEVMGHQIPLQLANLNVGFIFILAISSLSVYGIIMASWASNSKYAMLGGLRSTAQMISYELSLGLSLVALIICYGTVDLQQITVMQEGYYTLGTGYGLIPKWGILYQPVTFILFIVAIYAETNRLPFDLPEGEAEIVGFHLEYGGMKWSLFFMAEYINMTTASALMAVFFFGGWQLFPLMPELLNASGLQGDWLYWANVAMQHISFMIKLVLFMILFIVVRFTLPRFRYDQLMHLGWKVMVPIALLNILVTSGLVAFNVI